MKAEPKDKEIVVDILTKAFKDNKSVNYLVKQDARRMERIRSLMSYSFETCLMFGEIFITDDKAGCALTLLPGKKKLTLKSLLLDIELVIKSIGVTNLRKVFARESKIKNLQQQGPMYYLWFIGVDPNKQHKGCGSLLLNYVITQAKLKGLAVTLETSTLHNLPWYKKFGFEIYNELELTYKLYFLRKK